MTTTTRPLATLTLLLMIALAPPFGCASTPAVGEDSATPDPAGAAARIELVNDMPVVTVDSHGQTLRLILDLGGTDALALRHDIARSLNATPTGRTHLISDAFGALHRAREFVVDEVTFAGLHLRDVRGYDIPDSRVTIPGPPDTGPVRLDGYVGVDLLRRFNVLIDYPNQQLILTTHDDPAPVNVTDWPAAPFRFSRDGVVSPLRLAGHTMTACWDTGANHTVIRDKAVPKDTPRRPRGEHEAITLPLALPDHDLGPLDLVVLDFSQPRVDVIVGTNLFREHAVWFDFAHRRLHVAP